jgi:hypothetical protein
MSIEIIVYPQDEWNQKFGASQAGNHFTKGPGKHVIEWPEGTSTRARVHEVAHAMLGHSSADSKTWASVVVRELLAEAQTYKWMDKKVTWRIAIPLITELYHEAGVRDISTMFILLRDGLDQAGYPLSKKDTSELWWAIRMVLRGR